MQRAQEMNSLREQLLAEAANANAPPPYPPSATASQGPSGPYPPSDHSGSPHEHHQIDPNVAGGQMQYSMSGDHQMGDGSGKGKRELSTSKRAAQNRAAQRAFRQRKEGYIKKLEEQVKDYQSMEHNYKALQNENYQLREYILSLQSKLLENQAEFPPAPTHANLSTSAPQQYSRAESSYAAEQQERHDTERRAVPPAAVAAADEQRHDGMAALHEAAVAQDARPQSSPYGLANEYPSRQPETSGISDPKPDS